jgi:hypothetical protein
MGLSHISIHLASPIGWGVFYMAQLPVFFLCVPIIALIVAAYLAGMDRMIGLRLVAATIDDGAGRATKLRAAFSPRLLALLTLVPMILLGGQATSLLDVETAASGAIIGTVAAIAYWLGTAATSPDALAKGRAEGYDAGFLDGIRAQRARDSSEL